MMKRETPKADTRAKLPASAVQDAARTTPKTPEPQTIGQQDYPLGPQTTPAQIIQLQHLIGNRAVSNLVAQSRQLQPPSVPKQNIQRKYEDFDLTTAERDLGKKIADMLVRYNNSPALSTLEGAARDIQVDKDVKALQFILTTLSDIYDGRLEEEPFKTWERKLHEAKAKVLGAEAEVRDQALEVEVPTGPMNFTAFPRLPQPEAGKSILPGVEYIEATINGTVYHLYAGQDYLNAGYSLKLFRQAPTKTGNIDVYVSDQQKSKTFKDATIGDAHHRFVWGGFHGQPLTANLIPRGFPQKIYQWQELTYKHNPKHVFKFDTQHPITTKIFNAAVSSMPEYQGKFETDPLQFIIDMVKGLLNIPEVIFENGDDVKLVKYLSGLASAARPTPYAEKVKALEGAANNKEHAKSMADILLESFSAGEAPDVVLGPTPSIGYYSPDYHVVVLDPVKNPTPDAMLDTLSFEIGNALRRESFMSDKNAKASIEFGTMNDYINLLMEATHSGGINTLVANLGIDEKYLIPANAKTILGMKEPALDMPKESEVSGQKLRSALAWWKMQDWTEDERKQYFSTSAHAEGMEATGAGYKSGEEAKPPVEVKNSGKAQPSFKNLILEMARHYPRAEQYHFDELKPRHFGEFLLTGRIEKWHSVAGDEENKMPMDVMVSFHRDLKKVYANYDNGHMQNLTYADYGDFMMDGKIKSWEKM
jgi:hypothetical protein